MNNSLPDQTHRVRNFIISGTNCWNPGDDFVRDGVIKVLHQTFPGDLLNFHFYNFAEDQFPKSKFRGIGNDVSAGDLELCREFIDGVIIAGLSAGHEIKDLYNWIIANGLEDRIFLIGGGYENSYCAEHVMAEPEATIFREARIIIGRTANHPGFIKAASTPYVHLNCPALLSVPEVKIIPAGRKIQRIGFSIQLPHETGIVNQSCDGKVHRLACRLLLDLAKTHEVELIAHHKSEYFLFLHLLKDTGVPVIYSSFYRDLHDVYRRYDCVVTTRLHSSLYANGHGIPGIVVNDTDRHTHTLSGFPHSVWVNTREAFDREFARLQEIDLPRVAEEMRAFKHQLTQRYVTTLGSAFNALAEKADDHEPTEVNTYRFDSEKKEQLLVRSLVKPGMTVLDVGAHLGKYTKLFSLLVGEEGRVFSFEPTPATARNLAMRIESDHLNNVTLIRKAVCDHNGIVTLHQFPEEYSSWNGLGRPSMEDPRDASKLVPIVDETEVVATTLDQFCQAQRLAHIDYLKLDVEGAEIHALRGAVDLLSRKAVDCLQFEVSRKMLDGLGTSARDVFEFLDQYGYECHSIQEDGKIGPVATDSEAFYDNYAAFPVEIAVPVNPAKDLPINFFTIVLNGQPFIRHHIETLRQLPFQWHWHIIEGVAELKHDTGWSVATGGCIPDAFHKNGLSIDGTTEYLDELKRAFPDQITIHRPPAGKFWEGKREMVNAPLASITDESLLWQLDADELWTATQIIRCRALFFAHPEKTAALFFCNYFVGSDLVITSRDTYGNHSSFEWLRVWRFQPGDRWIAHEPPRLGRTANGAQSVDVGEMNPFLHAETEAMGLVFQHYAYATEAQVRFKQDYYGYPGALAQWQKLQEAKDFPCKLADYFAWVQDAATVNTATSQNIEHLITFDNHVSASNPTTSMPQRILFIRTDSIGDAVLASSMLEPIRRKYPDAQLAVLCQQHVAELYVSSPYINAVICFDRAAIETASSQKEILNDIIQFNPDLILNSVRSRDTLSEAITHAFPRARRVGIESDLNNIALSERDAAALKYDQLIPGDAQNNLELAHHAAFLRGLGIPTLVLKPVVWTNGDDEDLAEAFFRQHGLDPLRTIALFPSTQHDVKNFPNFGSALQELMGWNFLVFGGAESEANCAALTRALPGPSLNLAGRTTLREMAALIRRCRTVIGSDSCGAHIACAMGVPNVVVLGGGHFGRFFPYSPLTSAVALPLDCFDCNWRCSRSRPHCIKDVSPELLAEAVRQTLAKPSSKPRVFIQAASDWNGGTSLPAWQRPDKFLNGIDAEIIEVASVIESHELTPEAACPVCRTASTRVIVKRDQDYHSCPQCGVVFATHIAPAVIQTENSGNTSRHHELQDLARLARLADVLGRRPERMIDFGCGKGESLRVFQSQGIVAIGIDQDTLVQLKDIESASVDGITMVEVIEHLYDPHAIFRQFSRVLKPGGVVYVETSFVNNQDLASWAYLDPAIGHCTVHSVRSIERVAAAHDFALAWLNPNVCFLTKNASVAQVDDPSNLMQPLEIVGEGLADALISVVISTYNSERFLRPSLENLTRQTIFSQIEVIVVDSGSQQNEREIALEFVEKHPNIRYVRTNQETLYGAWNRGLALARGRYWANLNTDDSLRNDALAILVSALDNHPDCALAYGDTAWTTKPNDTFPSSHIVKTVKYPDYAPIETLFYCITGCLQFWRTDSIRELGGFDASLRCAGDYEATLKMMAARMNAVHVPEVLSLFFQNPIGLTQAGNRAAVEHDQATNRYRGTLDIANIFEIESGQPSAAANAYAVLGAHAARNLVPWEEKPFEHMDFAFTCFHAALDLDPDNLAAGTNLVVISDRLKRLDPEQPELINRWPKMREWINRFRMGEGAHLPPVKHALVGPVHRPVEWSHRPSADQLAGEPEALRPWICRMDGRHVYLTEDLFPRPRGFGYLPQELEAAGKRLAQLLSNLPAFYAHLGGAGDALLLMASFYDKQPDAVVFSHPNSIGATKALFEAFPKLSKIYFLPQHSEPFFHVILRYAFHELPNCLGAGATPEMDYFKEWNKGLNIFDKYGVMQLPEWAARFRQSSILSRIVTLAPKGSLAGMVGTKRNIIDPEIWPQVVQFVRESGYLPVIIGTPDDRAEYPSLDGCEDQRSYSFTAQMEWIGRSAILVGADSWAKTFSALADIPTLVFEPLKGPDWRGRKDASDYVFLDPWQAITVVKDLEQFKSVFQRISERTPQVQNLMPSATVEDNKTILVTWEGSFLDFGSLSHVNRALTDELAGIPSIALTLVGKKDGATPVHPALRDAASRLKATAPNHTQVTVRHAWPPKWSAPASGSLVVIQPWEYGALPKEWVDKSRHVREFWVPSQYTRRVYVNSGIAASKVKVVPNGIDPKIFFPKAAPLSLDTRKKYKFLFVGGTIQRKGPDVLLRAFLESFTADDDVCLVIKDFGGKSVYAGQTMESDILAAQSRPNAPEILYLTTEIAPEQIAGLYTACDCLVHPYRGEGFGLPVLEAMACGLPVVVTAGGATDDFAIDPYAYRIPAARRSIGSSAGGMPLAREGWVLEPDPSALAKQLRWIFENQDEPRAKGQAAVAYVREFWSWECAGRKASHALRDLAERDKAEAEAIIARRARQAGPIEVAPVGWLGGLAEARELILQKEWLPAWQAALQALTLRPFHPESWLLLSEVAHAAGDSVKSKQCLDRARQLTPKWNRVRQSSRKEPVRTGLALPLPSLPVMPVSPRLTVCLIVKNEEQFLERCLQSVREVAHQIVVVDTGSTDRTVEIARQFKAEVHNFVWNDDFSAARNESLQHATGDWVLVLDADEELQPQHRETLRKEMQASEIIAYRLPIVDQGKEQEGCSYVPRLFRNAPGVFFAGRVHEHVFASIEKIRQEWGMENQLGKTALLHHGYSEQVVASRNKTERNLTLLERAMAEMPNDPNLVMNYGLELVRAGQCAAGLDQYSEAFHLMSQLPAGAVSPESRETLLTQLLTHLLGAGEFSEIVRISETPLAKIRGLTASHHFLIGLAQMELKEPAAAAEHMRHCLAKRHRPALSPIHPEILRGGVNHTLAMALVRLKQSTAADQAFRAALADDPQSRPVRFDYAMFQSGRGEVVEALKLLHQIVAENPRDLHAWGAGGQIALGRPEFVEFARDWTSEAIKVFPNNSDIALLHAQALLLNGDAEGSLPFWMQGYSKTLPRHLAALVLCESVNGGSRRSFVSADERLVSHEFLKWYQLLVKTGANSLLYQLHENMEVLRVVLPSFVTMWEAAVGNVEQAISA